MKNFNNDDGFEEFVEVDPDLTLEADGDETNKDNSLDLIVEASDDSDTSSIENDSIEDFIKFEIENIPSDTDKIELTEILKPFLKEFATKDKATAESYLSLIIKRFGLSNAEEKAYRSTVDSLRKELTKKNALATSKPKTEYTAYFESLVDIVDTNGKTAFLVKEGNELKVIYKHQTTNGIIYLPPSQKHLPWLLPRAEEVIRYHQGQEVESVQTLDRKLFDDLVKYHQDISELPQLEYYDLIAAWDMHTYLQEQSEYTPIICFYAVPEKGKSRTGKGMTYVAWRGVHMESLRQAFLFRASHLLKATLFLDVTDIWTKTQKSDSEDILLGRFEKGFKVARVLYPEKGPFEDTEYFSIFGPTIIATNESVDKILETRSISITMTGSNKKFENDVKPKNGLALKERLVAFRARHLNEQLPEIEKPARGRLGDILRPIQQIIFLARPERIESFHKLVSVIQNEKSIEKSELLEAKILKAIDDCAGAVCNKTLSNKIITDHLNTDQPNNKFHLSYPRIGRILSSMGFRKTKMADGASGVILDERLLFRLHTEYGVFKKPSESSETF